MCNRNYILIITTLCTLEVCAADFSNLEESVIFSDSMSVPHAGQVDDMDIVNGNSSSESESENVFESSLININVDADIDTGYSVFERYFCVGKLPYSDQNKDDALLWRARLNVGYEAIEVRRIVGARAFIDVLKKRYQEYSSESIERIIAGVGRVYVQCGDDNLYNTLLDDVIALTKADRSSEIGLAYAKSEDRDELGCPLLARRIITDIRNFPKKQPYTGVEFHSWVQDRLKWLKHEGSYVVSADPEAVKKFVEEMVVCNGNVKSTVWQLVEIDE